MSSSLTKTFMHPAKTLQYNQIGDGRDTYIMRQNGGFYPDRKTNGVEEIGKYLIHLIIFVVIPICIRLVCNCETKTQKLIGKHPC